MLSSEISRNQRLVFALDVSTAIEAVRLVRILDGVVGCFKLGLELFVKDGPNALKAISENSQADLFLDLKLHDIPATVRGALRSASHFGAKYVTVHCEPGPPVLDPGSDSLPPDLKLLGITVLTSISEREFPLMGMAKDLTLNDLVLFRAEMAKKSGCAGVVCSGGEVAAVRKQCGEDFLVVTPGVRPDWIGISNDDQARTVTPREAIASGADLIVVGRPILTAPDPKIAAQRIVDEIEMGWKERIEESK